MFSLHENKDFNNLQPEDRHLKELFIYNLKVNLGCNCCYYCSERKDILTDTNTGLSWPILEMEGTGAGFYYERQKTVKNG